MSQVSEGRVSALAGAVLGAALVGAGLWGIGRPEATVCSADHCASVHSVYGGLFVLGLLPWVFLLGVGLRHALGRARRQRGGRGPGPRPLSDTPA